MQKRLLFALFVTAALVASACADPESGGDSAGYQHGTAPTDLILRVETGGGFLPVELVFSGHPDFSLMGDGAVITAAAQIAIFPPPALPALQTQTVDEDGIQEILAEADRVGLLEGGHHHDYSCVADAATTTFTVTVGGETSVTSAYALGIESTEQGPQEPPPGNGLPPPSEEGVDEDFMRCGLSDEELAARAALAEFTAMLVNLEAWLPPGSVGPAMPYEPEQMRVFVSPHAVSDEFPQEPVVWPLDTGLDVFGDPLPPADDLRCGVLDGEDLDQVVSVAAATSTLTPWLSAGEEWRLVFRALLPDETGCPDTE